MDLIAGFWNLVVCLTAAVLVFSAAWLVIQAFREHVLWGMAVLFIPFAYAVFAVLDWEHSRKPFMIGVVSLAALIVELLLLGGFQRLLGG